MNKTTKLVLAYAVFASVGAMCLQAGISLGSKPQETKQEQAYYSEESVQNSLDILSDCGNACSYDGTYLYGASVYPLHFYFGGKRVATSEALQDSKLNKKDVLYTYEQAERLYAAFLVWEAANHGAGR